jgi:hypothetical protein
MKYNEAVKNSKILNSYLLYKQLKGVAKKNSDLKFCFRYFYAQQFPILHIFVPTPHNETAWPYLK